MVLLPAHSLRHPQSPKAGIVSSWQSPQFPLAQQPFDQEQGQGNSRVHSIVFIVPGQDLAANRTFLEGIDRPEHFTQGRGVGRDERAASRELGELFQERQVRALHLPSRPPRALGIVAWRRTFASDTSDRDGVQGNPQLSTQHGCVDRIQGLGTGRLVMAIRQKDQHLLFRGATSRASRPTAIASPMLVPSSPASAGCTLSTDSLKNEWSRIGGHARSG